MGDFGPPFFLKENPMADPTYPTGVYRKQGGDMVVPSGANINVESGGSITHGDIAPTGIVRSGIHTATAGEASAGTLAITTGLSSVSAHIVQVLDTGNRVVTSDADITESSGALTVADGGSFAVTENYLVHWVAVGS